MPEGPRLRELDENTRRDHSRVDATDSITFLREYTSRTSWNFSETNRLISNLKKAPGESRFARYKSIAIDTCARELRAVLNAEWLKTGTLVPVPPSKSRSDPRYDARMERVCRAISPSADVRALVVQPGSHTAFHEGERATVAELAARYAIDETVATPAPTSIAIVDDVLTTGTHFKAMQSVLAARFPGVPTFGIFIARRVFPPEASAPDIFSIFD